ncbi:MAG: hypothetical protein Q9M92_10095 [Enterobacterales bacterium]|nr:hypothetical protein [Enterobacterales bacterium]
MSHPTQSRDISLTKISHLWSVFNASFLSRLRLFQPFFFLVLLALIRASALSAENIPRPVRQMPQAVSNNAVAALKIDDHYVLYSFNGLSATKTFQAVHHRSFSFNLANEQSKEITSLPVTKGRLASVAVSLNHQIYVIGGYSVADDGHEISTDEIYRYDPKNDRYYLETRIPVAVDDSLALVYQGRYIYLISGWSQDDNVSLVQVYDTQRKRWFNATPFPGPAVFGHAGGVVANQLIVVDGVKIIPASTKNGIEIRRQFVMSEQSWQGTIDPNQPSKIIWFSLPQHPGPALYRMASAGIESLGLVLFAGGSDNPYNYNGVGYDGQPSEASSRVFSYHFLQKKWQQQTDLAQASMDHRGLALSDKSAFIIGGMGEKQLTLKTIQTIPFSKLKTLQTKGNNLQ